MPSVRSSSSGLETPSQLAACIWVHALMQQCVTNIKTYTALAHLEQCIIIQLWVVILLCFHVEAAHSKKVYGLLEKKV